MGRGRGGGKKGEEEKKREKKNPSGVLISQHLVLNLHFLVGGFSDTHIVRSMGMRDSAIMWSTVVSPENLSSSSPLVLEL